MVSYGHTKSVAIYPCFLICVFSIPFGRDDGQGVILFKRSWNISFYFEIMKLSGSLLFSLPCLAPLLLEFLCFV